MVNVNQRLRNKCSTQKHLLDISFVLKIDLGVKGLFALALTDWCLLGQLLLFPLVLKSLQDVEPPKKTNVLMLQATPSKYKSSVNGEEDMDLKNKEGYNTHYKGLKHIKVHGPSSEPQLPKPKRKLVD